MVSVRDLKLPILMTGTALTEAQEAVDDAKNQVAMWRTTLNTAKNEYMEADRKKKAKQAGGSAGQSGPMSALSSLM